MNAGITTKSIREMMSRRVVGGGELLTHSVDRDTDSG
jgi:hypothetical protein